MLDGVYAINIAGHKFLDAFSKDKSIFDKY